MTNIFFEGKNQDVIQIDKHKDVQHLISLILCRCIPCDEITEQTASFSAQSVMARLYCSVSIVWLTQYQRGHKHTRQRKVHNSGTYLQIIRRSGTGRNPKSLKNGSSAGRDQATINIQIKRAEFKTTRSVPRKTLPTTHQFSFSQLFKALHHNGCECYWAVVIQTCVGGLFICAGTLEMDLTYVAWPRDWLKITARTPAGHVCWCHVTSIACICNIGIIPNLLLYLKLYLKDRELHG